MRWYQRYPGWDGTNAPLLSLLHCYAHDTTRYFMRDSECSQHGCCYRNFFGGWNLAFNDFGEVSLPDCSYEYKATKKTSIRNPFRPACYALFVIVAKPSVYPFKSFRDYAAKSFNRGRSYNPSALMLQGVMRYWLLALKCQLARPCVMRPYHETPFQKSGFW